LAFRDFFALPVIPDSIRNPVFFKLSPRSSPLSDGKRAGVLDTNVVIIQTVSEFLGIIVKPKIKKRGKRKR
jgi:hypothetical protein